MKFLKNYLTERRLRKTDFGGPEIKGQIYPLVSQALKEYWLEVGGYVELSRNGIRFVRMENDHVKIGKLATELLKENYGVAGELVSELYATAERLGKTEKFRQWGEIILSEDIEEILEFESGHPNVWRKFANLIEKTDDNVHLIYVGDFIRGYLATHLFLKEGRKSDVGFHVHTTDDGPGNSDKICSKRDGNFEIVISVSGLRNYRVWVLKPDAETEILYGY